MSVIEVEPAALWVPRDPASLSEAERLSLLPEEQRSEILSNYSDEQLRMLAYDWRFWRRPAQIAPDAAGWLTWFVRAGRGFGKTRVGGEWIREQIEAGAKRLALVGPTVGDTRDVMVEGESGLLSCFPPSDRPRYEPSKRRITFTRHNAIATTYSADEPDRLRGPQHEAGWGDEPASWKRGQEAWDNLSFGMRLGKRPRIILTGTPKPTAWLRDLSKSPTTTTTVGSTYDNVANLAPTFIAEVLSRYEGTTLGRQELHAMWLDDVEGALWLEAVIELGRRDSWDRGRSDRVIVSVDPPGETAECGIVVAGGPRKATVKSHAYVLDDMSMAGRPEAWGKQVVTAWRKWNADAVYVEANQGGDMVRAVIHNVDPDCPVRKHRAVDSKGDRASPVSALYERMRVHHVGVFEQLETQLTTWVPDESKSPDRLDAMVHAVNALIPPLGRAKGKIRVVTNRQIS